MPSHNLKSSYRHPYQKFMVPFWRHSNLPVTMCYSAETIEMFERQKEAFDQGAKFIQWEVKPKIMMKAEHLEEIFMRKINKKHRK